MNYKNKKFVSYFAFIVVYFMLFASLNNLNAETFSGKYENGITNLTYYQSADYNWYSGSLPGDAAYRWTSGSSVIKISRQYGIAYSKIDWYISYNQSYPLYPVYGHTEWWDSNEKNVPNADRNWYYAKIFLNSDTNLCALRNGCDAVIGTAAHELGHAFGLKHNYNANSIMSQSTYRKVQWPSSSDITEVHKKYGY